MAAKAVAIGTALAGLVTGLIAAALAVAVGTRAL